jgi:clan AA aspartic protease
LRKTPAAEPRARKITWRGLTHINVTLLVPGSANGAYESVFVVDTGATDSMAPASELLRAGIRPVGRASYELADGSSFEYEFGLAQIEFLGEITAGRVIFGPEGVEPLLGVTSLESVGISVDPTTQALKRLPHVPLK